MNNPNELWMPWLSILDAPKDSYIACNRLQGLGYQLQQKAPALNQTLRIAQKIIRRSAPKHGKWTKAWSVIQSLDAGALDELENAIPVAFAVNYLEPVCRFGMQELADHLDGKASSAGKWETSRMIVLERFNVPVTFPDRRIGQFYPFLRSVQRLNRVLVLTAFHERLPGDDDGDSMLFKLLRRIFGPDGSEIIQREAKSYTILEGS